MLTKNTGIITEFSGVEFSKYASKTGDFVKAIQITREPERTIPELGKSCLLSS